MKVVLFCGGLGMRIREYPEPVPKPMITIGYRPLLWHVMKYYAHYGHKDFILCLGYKADAIKNYFLNYDECVSNNFILSNGGKKLRLLNSDIHDWNITFVDTGIPSNIGQRLKAVEPYLEGESVFLANYSDGLTDLLLPEYINNFLRKGKIGSFLVGQAAPELPRRLGRGRRCQRPAPHQQGGYLDQRRVLHLPDGDFQVPEGRGGVGGATVPTPDPGGAAHRLQVRGVLGVHGHFQGQAAARRPLHPG